MMIMIQLTMITIYVAYHARAVCRDVAVDSRGARLGRYHNLYNIVYIICHSIYYIISYHIVFYHMIVYYTNIYIYI